MAEPRPRLLPEPGQTGGILPWVIGIMVFLVALTGSGALLLGHFTASWQNGLARAVTVRIDAAVPLDRDGQTRAALAYLEDMAEVESARILPDSELRGLLEPWLGPGSLEADLPIPALIDVRLREGATLTMATLGGRLASVAPDAAVDDHQQWLGQVRLIAASIQGLGAGIACLVTIATIFVVALATRSGLNNHRPTIEILHLIGAEDDMIAQEFQWRFFWMGLRGGLAGAAAGAAAVIGIGWLAAGLIADSGATWTPPWPLWALFLTLPAIVALLTMWTARLTVRRALAAYL